ncbi:MAG: carbamoyltransferase HypF [Rubrivivax sp.]|jgi:hydrogenase maturation protein HypF|nr:carbamoyltransferase HypF [Rubrivivax sp.]
MRVLATGAFLKNRAALWHRGVWHWSTPHGDLGTAEACRALEAGVDALLREAGGAVDAVAHDLHPDFHSTRVAVQVATRFGAPAVPVQHHHAHVAVAMAEHGIDGIVVGIALDGVGLGSDGTAWGGEVLVVDGAGFRRAAHLAPLAMPGGDRAAVEPWRMAAAALHALGRGDEIEARFASAVGPTLARGVASMLDRRLRCPPTSGAGRWFDAAAGLLGVSVRQSHEAEAAIALEALATTRPDDGETLQLPVAGGAIDHRPLTRRLLELGDAGRAADAAALFHRSLADSLAAAAVQAAARADTGVVALGGGCFFNRLLSRRLQHGLEAAGLRVLRPQAACCGDAGLALGQAWVARLHLDDRADAQTEGALACV